MAVAEITKITLNMGVGERLPTGKVIEHAVSDMIALAGQKPVVTKSAPVHRRFQGSRELPGGCEGDAAQRSACTSSWERLVSIARRASATSAASRQPASDGRATNNFGITEQIIFPEIDYDKVDQIRGMNSPSPHC